MKYSPYSSVNNIHTDKENNLNIYSLMIFKFVIVYYTKYNTKILVIRCLIFTIHTQIIKHNIFHLYQLNNLNGPITD